MATFALIHGGRKRLGLALGRARAAQGRARPDRRRSPVGRRIGRLVAYGWTAKEVVRDIDEHPSLFLRLELTGPYFGARALEPFVLVGRVRSRFVRIDQEGLRALAYFDRRLPEDGEVAFGWGEEALYLFPRRFDLSGVARLDRGRLPRRLEIPEGL
jgi:hypothetical protein